MSSKALKLMRNPLLLFPYLCSKGLFNWMDDKTYIEMEYRAYTGNKLNLSSPETFNEKIQWLKLYYHDPILVQCVDKYLVRDFVEKRIGSQYLIPLLGVWNESSEIDFDALPNSFVLKCNHDSSNVHICKDKYQFDTKRACKLLDKALKKNYFYSGREWAYKNVVPRIIAEQYMQDGRNNDLPDYKFFCFDGEPSFLYIATNRNVDMRMDFYDAEGNHLDLVSNKPNADDPIEMPECFEEMKEIARRLSSGFPQVRIDLYEINGKVYFGEMTFYNWCGYALFDPPEWDLIFGKKCALPAPLLEGKND